MKQVKSLLIVFITIIFHDKTAAQITPAWATTYVSNYPQTIEENDMAVDKNGNVYVLGYTIDTVYKVTAVTMKYDTYGQLQWIQHYDSISYYSNLALDDSGNVYIAGHYGDDLLTIKYNSQGAMKWVKFYHSLAPVTWSYDITTDDICNVYVTGLSNGNRLTTLKYDTHGALQWATLDSVAEGSSKSFITIDKNKNVYIAGRRDTVGYPYTCNTIKYNSLGIKQWERTYKSNLNPGLSGPQDLKYHSSGFIYLLAYSSNNSGNGDIAVVKYDTLGNQIWKSTQSFTNYYDIPNSMVIDKTGNVYVTGNIWPTGGTKDSIVTFKISKSGVFKWIKKYSLGYHNNDEAKGIAIDSLDYIYVTGKSSDSFSRENFVTLKYDTLGNEIWVGRYHNTTYSSDYANSICLDQFANIYVSGTTYDNNFTGVLTIKYSNAVGIRDLQTNVRDVVSVYPNPFEENLTIKVDKYLEDAELSVYDEFGKEIIKMNNISGQTFHIQRGDLAAGIYFFRLTERDQIIGKGKLVAQ